MFHKVFIKPGDKSAERPNFLLDLQAWTFYSCFWHQGNISQHFSQICSYCAYKSDAVHTGWSKKTVNCNLIVTGVKFTKNGKTQLFLEMVHREVLIIWCLDSVKWKQFCLSRHCRNNGLAPDWLEIIHGEKNLLLPVSYCWRLLAPNTAL